MSEVANAHATGMRTLHARAGYMPTLPDAALSWETLVYSAHGQRLEVASATPDAQQLQTLAAHVREQARQTLAPLPVLTIVDIIDRTVAWMLDPDNPERAQMEYKLAITSGFDPEMTRQGVRAMLRTFRRAQLLQFLAQDFGDPGMLDDFRPRVTGGLSRAYGPALLAHVWAGNVPALPMWSLVSGLLVKAGCLGKVSTGEPLFAGWFARSLARVAPQLAGCLAIVWWRGGNAALQTVFCEQAELVKVYGGDAAIAAWQATLPPGKRLLAHGPRLGVGLVSASALDAHQCPITARKAARDMVRWDQQACYAPQVFYVARAGQCCPRTFALALAGQLRALQTTEPRRRLSLEEAAALARWRQALELAQLRGKAIDVFGAPEADWVVACTDDADVLMPGALNRSVLVVGVDHLADAVTLIAPRHTVLQTAGIAASTEEILSLAPLLGAAGITRICALGATGEPQAGWHHDGRFSLLDLVRMVDLEASALAHGDTLTRYRD